jgi:hypothetical protein
MLTLSPDWIVSERERRYRRRPDLRIQTLDAAIEHIDDVGFALFWPIKGVEAPSLFDAVAGRVRELTSEHDDPDISLTWGWKDESLGKGYWYYAHLLRRKATLIAPRLWGDFYALTRNYGDLNDYKEQVRDGIMTHEARQIYEALLGQGPLNTVELRRQSQLSARESKSRFDRGLLELQIDMKALPVGVAEAGAWRYSFVYDIPMRHYPDLVTQARAVRTADAWQTLIGQHVDNVVAATTRQIGQMFHVFTPIPREIERALAALVEAGRIEAAQVEAGDEVWVSKAVLSGEC